jgi:hypothetical protein
VLGETRAVQKVPKKKMTKLKKTKMAKKMKMMRNTKLKKKMKLMKFYEEVPWYSQLAPPMLKRDLRPW